MDAQYLQFAANGIWEDALRLEIPVNKAVLSDWLATASDDVALEVFSGEAAFIGLRLKPFQHLSQLLHLCDNPSIETIRTIFAAPQLFRGKPDFAELGVVNAWKSVGAVKLWQQGKTIPTLESLEKLLENSILWTQAKPLALEFAYIKPLPHWRAVPVSEKIQNDYRLNLALLHQVLSQQSV
jgi:hypothetical protein